MTLYDEAVALAKSKADGCLLERVEDWPCVECAVFWTLRLLKARGVPLDDLEDGRMEQCGSSFYEALEPPTPLELVYRIVKDKA